jgi:hypothetical protein
MMKGILRATATTVWIRPLIKFAISMCFHGPVITEPIRRVYSP